MARIHYLPFLGLLAAGAVAPLLGDNATDRVTAVFAPGTSVHAALADAVAAGFRPIAFGAAGSVPILLLGRPATAAALPHALLIPAFGAALCSYILLANRN